MNTGLLRILSRAFFFLGVALGCTISGVAVWNNFESTSYFFAGVKQTPFNGLHCPLMLAPAEKGIITAVFNNPTTDNDDFFYRAEISGKAFSRRQIEDHIEVPAHRTKAIRLEVDANDVDLLFFIFVKISIFPNSVHPSQEAVCGVMMANILGLTGAQISTAALFLSFLGMAIGLGLWRQTGTKADRDMRRAMQTLGFMALLTMFAAAMGWWIAAIVLLVLIILLLVVSLRFVIA